ncbi:MAG: type II secretion system protein [Phycisphaerae bacterium]|jgi:prepilin-type N-terminal cleavage/methylation domain-containing protein
MRKNGFTLIEVLIAILLVGVAIAALVAANGSFTKANAAATDLSTAEFLIEQVRERSISIRYDNLSSLNGTFSPPINSAGESLNGFAVFSEQITVENVSESNFEQAVAYDSGFIRVTVKVFLNSKEISSARWLRADIDE